MSDLRTVRRLWRVFEPYHAITYFSPETTTAFKAAGLRGFWMGYFAGRAAPMGPVGSGLVAATFYNFAPRMVSRSIPDAWGFASPQAVLEARITGVDEALSRILGERLSGPEMAEAAGIAEDAVAVTDVAGRPIFAANAQLAPPQEPHLRLWWAVTCLREHRGDGHVAALVQAGIDGCEAHITLVATGALSRSVLQPNRGWTDDEWASATERIRVARVAGRGRDPQPRGQGRQTASRERHRQPRFGAMAAHRIDSLGAVHRATRAADRHHSCVRRDPDSEPHWIAREMSQMKFRFGPTTKSAVVVSAMCLVFLGACGTSSKPASSSGFGNAPFAGNGSIDEAYAIGASPGEHLVVVDSTGKQVGSGVVDKLGGIVVSNLTPGPGYRFRTTGANSLETAPFSVLSTGSTPTPSFYSSQQLHAGLNYVRMRDGIMIAATVRLPPGKTLADGPFPTVIEYSGYDGRRSAQPDQCVGG